VALQAVRRANARLIATNPDRTCPVEGGEIPDCAGMIAAVEAVTGHTVEAIVGKPSPIILEVALDALGVAASDAVIVGDRLETDMTMGKRLGLATVLGVLLTEYVEPLARHGLALSAGVTLYVAASNLIPEVQKGRRPGLAITVVVGAALFYGTFLMLRGVMH
jgi:FMN phosphatase YigB (HAD superfamily)